MLASLKRAFKWGSAKSSESKKHKSLLLTGFIALLEDVLLWRKMSLSLSCIFLLNVIFFICIHWEINFLELIFCIWATILSVDAFETWLKYKHRTACLKRLSDAESPELNKIAFKLNNWIRRKCMEFSYLRESNHTKAFLLVNIFFTTVFLVGKYMSGYALLYVLCMFVCFSHQIAPSVWELMKKIQQHAESDGELEGLIPEMSEIDVKFLSIEPEPPVMDERQSLDYWKPEDLPLEDGSDSSEHSTSLVTNISMEKLKSLDKDVDMDTSDSSEDEYIPLDQQKEPLLQSTMEVVQPASSWSNTAYNAFFNVTGAVANMVYSAQASIYKKTGF
ncbi:hypothetical protein O0L34_g7128 [Tuta absoluta]|nr:hypothetical protein O0L34_g7128 [Tuta absoluta]